MEVFTMIGVKKTTHEILHSDLTVNKKNLLIEEKMRYYTEPREERRMKDKLHIANNLMNELKIDGAMRDEVKEMLKVEFRNLKKLSKNCSKEQIIGLIIFYVMKNYNTRAKISDYKVFNQLKITDANYITFTTKLCRHYQEKTPIKTRS